MRDQEAQLQELANNLDDAQSRHRSKTIDFTFKGVRSPINYREPPALLIISCVSLALALLGIFQTNNSAKLDLATARLSVVPILEMRVDSRTQTVALHNHGNGAANIYYVKVAHKGGYIEVIKNVPMPDEMLEFYPSVLQYLYNESSLNPHSTIEGPTQVVVSGGKINLLQVDDVLPKDKKNIFVKISDHFELTACYTDLLEDMIYGFSSKGQSVECPMPPAKVQFTLDESRKL